MGNKRWYEILNRAYGVDWEMDKGFQWLNMNRWYGLTLDEVQDTITRFEFGHSLLTLSEQQVRYVVDRYGLRQVAERVESEMDELEFWEEVKQYILSKGMDRMDLAGRGNNKNSDLIIGEEGEIVGFTFNDRTFM